jgi:hypothetical protein
VRKTGLNFRVRDEIRFSSRPLLVLRCIKVDESAIFPVAKRGVRSSGN